MIQPPALKQGDSVGIVAPARKIDSMLIDTAKAMLESWGLKVEIGQHIFVDDHSYFSASDEKRIHDFQTFLNAEHIRAIICARGGYGSTRIIDRLDFSNFLQRPKWITGYSDITALHLMLQSIQVQSMHSTVPALFTKPDADLSVAYLKNMLFGERPTIQVKADEKNRLGLANGRLIGGNLSLLVDSLGTSSEIDTSGKILIIEDVGEHYYRLDRMMVQLRRSNKLKNLSGLVAGYFTDIKESVLPFNETVKDIILNHTKEYNFPVAFNFPIGHEEPNLPFVEGANAMLVVNEQEASLSYKKELINP
ncbi:LD-carboxypeptidase [Chryseotalea sanaruensis]|uniref:LD-carboxypeptidase n=1 Tax=Chryseotalea sanaruensis TaxID=2482724 RepID=A0A401U8I3_9BACT|nr:LD-carboxypeptidase [Chryseotalea sanaruensis]GCC51186.1 LD-carboxypeptidase [Chryseotalea sanaruensis]